MELFSFGREAAFAPQQDLLDGVTIAPLTPPLSGGSPVQCAVFRIAPGGRIGRHPATVPQLLAVVEGHGIVSGGDAADHAIAAGEAVFWDEGEEHETRSEGGLTAVVLEGAGLRSFRRPPFGGGG